MPDPHDIIYHLAEIRPDTVEQTIEACFDVGLTTTKEGNKDIATSYWSGRHGSLAGGKRGDADIATVIDEITDDGKGMVDLWYDEQLGFSVTFDFGPESEQFTVPRANSGIDDYVIQISFDPISLDYTKEWDGYDRDRVRKRIETIIEMTAEITEAVAPAYVWSFTDIGTYRPQGPIPDEYPLEETIEALGWLTVLSEQMIANLGGREHVLETPAWEVKPLDSGHILIVATDNPVKPTAGSEAAVVEHLFGDG